MGSLEFTTFINTITNFIACNSDDDELNLLSVVFSQIGDTLATIAVHRSLCDKDKSQ